jgi:hypothetical protein
MRAVVLLMTSSNLVDCTTGKSPGLASPRAQGGQPFVLHVHCVPLPVAPATPAATFFANSAMAASHRRTEVAGVQREDSRYDTV